MDKANIELVPRWIWKRITVPQSGTVAVDPSDFANTTAYPMRLRWITITGKPSLAGDPYDVAQGGVVRRLDIEVGITGYSDINLVPGAGLAMFAPYRTRQRDNGAHSDTGTRIDIPTPVRVPKDGGLIVEVENTFEQPNGVVGALDDYFDYPAIVGFGYYEESRIPGFLAGKYDGVLPLGSKVQIDASDLLNKGREAFILTDLCVNSWAVVSTGVEVSTPIPYLTNLSWKINPSSGIEWMPRSPIPLGCLSPFTRVYDLQDQGPKTYQLPPRTVLMPRQRIGMRFTELSAAEQTIDVCVFGELEVR